MINRELIFGPKVEGFDDLDEFERFMFPVVSFLTGLLAAFLLFLVVVATLTLVSHLGWIGWLLPLAGVVIYRVGRYIVIKSDVLGL